LGLAAHESFRFSGVGPSRFGAEGILRYVRRKAVFTNILGPVDVTGQIVKI
jgi:hypothetical protein